ncbi:DUF6236 family protein [Methylorubrum populi]|uniref:DUF6236 family protein n=1 Tax=Methylorubrum populi TaxID=223967 RepID=UPI0031F99D76
MGEAKWRSKRRQSNDKFGNGILLPSMIKITELGFSYYGTSPDELNGALLYWNKIAIPTESVIKFQLPSEELLIKEGILLRPLIETYTQYSGNQLAYAMARSRVDLYNKLNRTSPSYWSFSGGDIDLLSETEEFTEGRTAMVELVAALPLPPEGTEVEDILEFKQNRKDELLALQSELNNMYLAIASSGDGPVALEMQIRLLEKSCSALIKTSSEWWKNIQMSDLRSTVPLFAGAGALVGLPMSMPGVAAFGGAAVGIIKIADGVRKKIKSDRKSPYWYACEVAKKL